jgi:hypothetical protein
MLQKENKKKCLVFLHMAKSLKDKKKKKIITSYFHTSKIQKIYVLACILALITSLLKP